MENTQPAGTAPGYFSSLKQDFLASIVVFLVALPLCMGIAIASGVPPEKAAAGWWWVLSPVALSKSLAPQRG